MFSFKMIAASCEGDRKIQFIEKSWNCGRSGALDAFKPRVVASIV